MGRSMSWQHEPFPCALRVRAGHQHVPRCQESRLPLHGRRPFRGIMQAIRQRTHEKLLKLAAHIMDRHTHVITTIARILWVFNESRFRPHGQIIIFLSRFCRIHLRPFQRMPVQQILVDQHGQRMQVRVDARQFPMRIIQGQVHRLQDFRRYVFTRTSHLRRIQSRYDQGIDVDDDPSAGLWIDEHVIAGKVRMGQPGLMETPHRPGQQQRDSQHLLEISQFCLFQPLAVLRGEPFALLVLAFERQRCRSTLPEEEIPGISRTDHAKGRIFHQIDWPAEQVSEIRCGLYRATSRTSLRFCQGRIILAYDRLQAFPHVRVSRIFRVIEELHDELPVRCEVGMLHPTTRWVVCLYIGDCPATHKRGFLLPSTHLLSHQLTSSAWR